MNKIKWDMEKEDSFFRNAKHIIVCNECGWLLKNPELEEKCPNCGIKYESTKSQSVQC